MLIEDLLGTRGVTYTPAFQTIRTSCSQFLDESAGLPLFKLLPTTYDDIHRVKVRAKKRPSAVGEAFNRAFEQNYANISQRAVFASPAMPMADVGHEPFFVFPINGFRFIYSKEVLESTSGYQQVLNTIMEQLNDEQVANELVSDLLKFSYTSANLHEGINSNCEIIMYGIQYYYAVRCSSYPEYQQIISAQHHHKYNDKKEDICQNSSYSPSIQHKN